jgi:hypothetical protein
MSGFLRTPTFDLKGKRALITGASSSSASASASASASPALLLWQNMGLKSHWQRVAGKNSLKWQLR